MHSAICETYSVSWFSIDLCSIVGGGKLEGDSGLAQNLKVTLVVNLKVSCLTPNLKVTLAANLKVSCLALNLKVTLVVNLKIPCHQ